MGATSTSTSGRVRRPRTIAGTATIAGLLALAGCTGDPTTSAAPHAGGTTAGGASATEAAATSGPMTLSREQVDAALPTIPGLVTFDDLDAYGTGTLTRV